MMNLKVLFLILVVPLFVTAQLDNRDDIKKRYDLVLDGNTAPSMNQILKYARSGNSYHFMAIGYFFDANNVMFKKTKEPKYIQANWKVFQQLFGKKTEKNFYNTK